MKSEAELYLFIVSRPKCVGSAANNHCLDDFIEHPYQFIVQNMLFMYYKVFLRHLRPDYGLSTAAVLEINPYEIIRLTWGNKPLFCLKVSWIIRSEFPEGRRESSSKILLKYRKCCPPNKILCDSHIYTEMYHFIYQHNNPPPPNPKSNKIKRNVLQLPSPLWLFISRKHLLD